MKKKPLPEPTISPEIEPAAKKSVDMERMDSNQVCAVCGGLTVPLTGPQTDEKEDLCWVCRRLKISAWREADQGVSLQE